MKKIITILSFILLGLSGCGLSDPTATETPKDVYVGNNFSIKIAQDWEVLNKNDFPSTMPTETVLIIKNKNKDSVFTANLNVAEQKIKKGVLATDIAKGTKQKAKSSLLNYVEISESTNKDSSIVKRIFEGKKSAIDPIIRFKQLYAKKEVTGIIVTASFLPNEKESVVKMIDEMLDSFALN